MRIIEVYKSSYQGLSKSIWYLAIIMLVNRAGAMVVPFLSLYLTQEKGFNLSTVGIIMSCYGIGSLLGTYTGGKLADAFGNYKVMLYSLIGAGISFMVLKEVDGFFPICIALIITIAIADAFRPANMASVADYSEEKDRTRAIGLVRLAINAGYAIGPAIGGIIVGFWGYGSLFVIDGMTSLMAAACFVFLFDDLHKTKDKTLHKEQKIDRSNLKVDAPYIAFLGLVGVSGFIFIQFFNTVPVFVSTYMGMSEADYGILISYSCVIILLFEMPALPLLEKLKNPYIPVIAGVLCMAFCYAFFLIGNWVILAWLSVTLLTIGEMLNLPFTNSISLNRAPDYARGKYMGQYGIAWSICHIFAPLVGFSIADKFGFNTLWWVLLIGGIFCAIGFKLIAPIMIRTRPEKH